MNLIHVLLLVPVGYAGAFTLFPVLEPAMAPQNLQDVLVMLLLLAPAYAYIGLALLWMRRWGPAGQFLGFSARVWIFLMAIAYGTGAGGVILLAAL